MSCDLPKRTSRRLAGQKRRLEESAALQNSTNNGACYRPKATDPAILQDCGILPSE
jgi:hypothetical protein